MNKHPRVELLMRLSAPALALAVGCSVLTGCDTIVEGSPAAVAAATTDQQPSPATAPDTAPAPIRLVPDMSGFLDPKDASRCFDGGPRPCAPIIRSAPNFSATTQQLNTQAPTASQKAAPWPLESYNGSPGDPVTVECYVEGPKDTQYTGKRLTSMVWYEVLVPKENVLDPSAQTWLTDNRLDVVSGFISVTNFNTATAASGVEPC